MKPQPILQRNNANKHTMCKVNNLVTEYLQSFLMSIQAINLKLSVQHYSLTKQKQHGQFCILI